MIHEVRVPPLNSDDKVVLLIEWLAEDGTEVLEGQSLCTIETKKVATEIEAERPGTLKHAARAGSSVPVQSVLAWIADSAEELEGVRR